MEAAPGMTLLDRLFGRAEVADATPTLATAAPGGQYRVTRVSIADPLRSDRLAALGLLPGTHLILRQRRPAYVIELGETTLALDRDLAACVEVEPA